MRVLVVEDVQRLADDIGEGLRDQGMAVDVVYDGLAAVQRIVLHPYDVVVLDRDLPGLHGDAVARVVTGQPQPPLVLMLTASDAPAQRVEGLELGADDYLTKPFHFPELVLRVRGLARRRPLAEPRELRRAGLVLVPQRRALTRDAVPVELSPKEFALLEALMRASPSVLSAEQLLATVWDENADPFSKTVQVTIGRLRRRLGEPDPIRTVPGAGYVIDDS